MKSSRRTLSVSLGFGGLLLMMGILVFDSGRQLNDVTLDSSRLRKEYRDRNALLDELRTNIYQASTILRDQFLQVNDTDADTLSQELRSIRDRNRAILARYRHLVLPDELPSVQTLQLREDAYMDALLATLEDPDRTVGKNTDQRYFYRKYVLPLRDSLIGVIAQVNALDQRDIIAGEDRVQTLHAEFQRRVASISFLAMWVSAILGVIVVLRHRYLEREAASQFEEVQAARRDLRLLSNQLVMAHEEERRNLSRELHDEVGQSMTAMLMELSRLESRLSGTDDCCNILASVRQTAEEIVARVRDLSLLLRPSMLDELGLVPALRWQVKEVSRRNGLKVKMIADEFQEDLPEAYRTCVYRIVQEALHNCVKHAHATEARVFIQRDPEGLNVSVQDNGIGFDAKTERGLGLLGIEERVMRMNGSFSVESHTGQGTVLSIRLPVKATTASAVQESVA